MKKAFASHSLNGKISALLATILGAALLLIFATPSRAQKDKKKKNQPPAADNTPIIPMSDEAQIDYLISEMLGAWQLGDTERMHKDYADDVTMVNGIWAPPVFTWTNYLAAYQQQHARMQQVRMDRTNTYTKVQGNVAWSCYQWDFSGVVDGQPSAARGQTTLVLEKRNGRWLIVHNHTSTAASAGAPAPQVTQPQTNGPAGR
jgi:ketosteroid isomerase-like protein